MDTQNTKRLIARHVALKSDVIDSIKHLTFIISNNINNDESRVSLMA